VVFARGGGLGIVTGAGITARGRIVPSIAGRLGASPADRPPRRGVSGVSPIVRMGGRGVAGALARPAFRSGVLAGPGQPGTPASTGTGPVGLIRFPGAAAGVSLSRPVPGRPCAAGPRGTRPDIGIRPVPGRPFPGRGRLPGPGVLGSCAGAGWLRLVFLVGVAEITDEGQRDAPRRGDGLFLLVGFLRLDVGFLSAAPPFLPAPAPPPAP